MPKTKTNDPGAHHASSGALIRRFLPYLANYKMVLCLDLFCAALTTLCDIVLPKIMSTITNSAMGVGITLTAGIVLKLAALYFVLRIIDGAASYYMSASATSWACILKRICAGMPLIIFCSWITPTTTTPRWAPSWGASPTICLM